MGLAQRDAVRVAPSRLICAQEARLVDRRRCGESAI